MPKSRTSARSQQVKFCHLCERKAAAEMRACGQNIAVCWANWESAKAFGSETHHGPHTAKEIIGSLIEACTGPQIELQIVAEQ